MRVTLKCSDLQVPKLPDIYLSKQNKAPELNYLEDSCQL